MLDTNIIIHAQDDLNSVLKKFAENADSLFTSTLCLVELHRGLVSEPRATALRRARLDLLLSQIAILPFDVAAADAYAGIIAERGFVRSRDFDRMIAAHALSVNAVLVTDNEVDFADIPGLALENWTAGQA